MRSPETATFYEAIRRALLETEKPVPEDLPHLDKDNAIQLLISTQTREFQESCCQATQALRQMLVYLPLDHPRREDYTTLLWRVEAIYETARALRPVVL